MSKYIPPKGIGLPPQPPAQNTSSYTNRAAKADTKTLGDNEQGNSLDFSSVIKRDVLSSPKTSTTHDR